MPAGSDVPLCEAAAEGRVSDVEELLKEEDGRSGAAEIKRVLVIVAGAAGLAAAVELAREGHDVVVYEKSSEIGGVWNYAPEADSDPLSFDPQRKRVHSMEWMLFAFARASSQASETDSGDAEEEIVVASRDDLESSKPFMRRCRRIIHTPRGDELRVNAEEKVSAALKEEAVEFKYFWGSTLFHVYEPRQIADQCLDSRSDQFVSKQCLEKRSSPIEISSSPSNASGREAHRGSLANHGARIVGMMTFA
ncbi:hypothetical protein AXG93_1658s1070 [Marchantia polymorpha subsp. ruderalis]|uniref:Flavin-containing monooxygenase n=1 Tax=Marchantia polymorpha subsp. ruderalis TaxID=1480154 RepID=A0A176WLI1_MARPO|nr:hypothetical protein AXG93_1658s1070 [Marchantia polymorpha subsp. ruderalis]